MSANVVHGQLIVTMAAEFSPELVEWACERGADSALSLGRTAAIVGMSSDNHLLVCCDRCCDNLPGALLAVTDTEAAEAAASTGRVLPTGTQSLRRDDGRVVYLFRGTGGRDRR